MYAVLIIGFMWIISPLIILAQPDSTFIPKVIQPPPRKLFWIGFVNKVGKEVIPPQYEDASPFADGFAAVKLNGKWGFIDTSGKWLVEPKYTNVLNFQNGFAPVMQSSKIGFIDVNGNEVISPQFIGIQFFKEGKAGVQFVGDSSWGFINQTGKRLTENKYDTVRSFRNGFAAVRKFNKWGVIDSNGHEVISTVYDYIGDFFDGLAVVEKAGKMGHININGQEIVPLHYDLVSDFCEGLAAVVQNEKMGFVTTNGKLQMPIQYDPDPFFARLREGKTRYCFNEGYTAIRIGDSCGFLHKSGKETWLLKYDIVTDFSSGWALVRPSLGNLRDSTPEVRRKLYKSALWGVIDTTGCEVVVPSFKRNEILIVGQMIGQKVGNKYRLVGKANQEIQPPIYDEIGDISDGVIAVRIAKKWGFIDSVGNKLTDCIFDQIGQTGFHEGITIIRQNKLYGFLSKTGQIITEPKYAKVSNFQNGFARVLIPRN